jgi:hypothetical protein
MSISKKLFTLLLLASCLSSYAVTRERKLRWGEDRSDAVYYMKACLDMQKVSIDSSKKSVAALLAKSQIDMDAAVERHQSRSAVRQMLGQLVSFGEDVYCPTTPEFPQSALGKVNAYKTRIKELKAIEASLNKLIQNQKDEMLVLVPYDLKPATKNPNHRNLEIALQTAEGHVIAEGNKINGELNRYSAQPLNYIRCDIELSNLQTSR